MSIWNNLDNSSLIDVFLLFDDDIRLHDVDPIHMIRCLP